MDDKILKEMLAYLYDIESDLLRDCYEGDPDEAPGLWIRNNPYIADGFFLDKLFDVKPVSVMRYKDDVQITVGKFIDIAGYYPEVDPKNGQMFVYPKSK